jgi:hypothetical protein
MNASKASPATVVIISVLLPVFMAWADAPKIVQLRSVNTPDRYVRHRAYLGELTPVSSELDKQDSRFIIRPGLAGKGVSFESVNFPGFFLRHESFAIKLQEREESRL